MNHIGLGTFETTPKMRQMVNRVLDTGRLSYGPMSQEFEQRFSKMHGCKFGVLSNSGTSSLLVALQTLKEMHGWQDGYEVIVPALTFVATVNVVLQLRLKPVLVDIEPDYYGIDTDLIGGAITKRTRCIMPVHTFGQPCNLRDLPFGLKIIEDSCEAMLVKYCGQLVGSWGDIGCFSTYVAHLLVTGVGGLAITNNPDYAQYMRSLINHGIDLTELPTGEQYDPSWLARKFRFSRVGHSFRLTELEAALGLAQLNDLAGIIKQRRVNALYLTNLLKPFGDKLQLPAIRPDTGHSFMMYPIVCRQPGQRDNLCRHLEANGIGTRLALPLTNQPVYKRLWNPANYPVADWMNRNAFYVGIHQGLIKDDLNYMAEKIGEFYVIHG